MQKTEFLKKILASKNSNFGIDLDGSKYSVISFSGEISTSHGGAKEVQNFKLKVHIGPEGSRGLD